ncbi:hypothetical protein IWX78_001590 [Mycetocola sp. CAN_C7]|uniref:hypothetical protein n=1 Tax=Mycetocola sp. CAN_C7 TaxID=2787724 RepID=UPI0018CB048B
MNGSSRSVMALASLGVGLVHLAVGAGSPLLPAILLVGFGIAELAWGVAILASGRILLPLAAFPLSLVPVALWGLDVTAAIALSGTGMTAALPFGPMAAATVLSLFIGFSLAASRRRSVSGQDATTPARPGRYLLGMLAGSLLVAGLVTPALAGTKAGTAAVPHGEHGTTTVVDKTPSPSDDTPAHQGH